MRRISNSCSTRQRTPRPQPAGVRSDLVNLDHIGAIEPLDTGDARLHLRGGRTLPRSRTYRPQLRERAGT
jgi:hypothetical protein